MEIYMKALNTYLVQENKMDHIYTHYLIDLFFGLRLRQSFVETSDWHFPN